MAPEPDDNRVVVGAEQDGTPTDLEVLRDLLQRGVAEGRDVEAGLQGVGVRGESREQGLGAKMIGFDSLETAEFGQLGGAATNGVLMSFPPKPDTDPKNAALVKKFQDQKYNPEGYTLFSYAAIKVWAEAANKAKSTDPAAVAAALRAGKYDSAVGPLEFDAKGDIKNPVYDIYVWKDGKSFPAGK